jgi:hypothetical protein
MNMSNSAGQRKDNILQQNTFEYVVPGARRSIQAKMATKLGGKPKGSSNKTIPSKHNTLKLKIDITSNFRAMVSGHGKKKAYLHRFTYKDEGVHRNR